MRILESERLILKPVEEEDIYYLLDLRWDAEVMTYLLHEPISKSKQLEWYRSTIEKDYPFSIFFKKDNKMEICGTAGLYNISMRHQRATAKLRLDPKFQGIGIGTEALRMVIEYGFNTLNLQKMVGDRFDENKAAVNYHRKLGFVDEGHLRRHYYHNGEFKDVTLIGLLKEDFFRAIEK